MNNPILKPNTNQLPVNNLQESELSISALLSNLKRKWKPSAIVALTVIAWLTFTSLKKEPVYQSSMKMLIATQEGSAIGYQYYSTRNIDTEIEYLKSYPILEKAVQRLKNEFPTISIGELASSVQVSRGVTPDILNISCSSSIPDKTKKILEVMAEVYIDYSIQRQRSKANKGLDFIEGQLPKARQESKKIGEEIREFQEKFNVLNPDTLASVTFGTKENLSKQIEEMELKLKLTKDEKNNQAKQLRETGYTKEINIADIVITDDSLARRLEGLTDENDIKVNLEATKYQDIYPVIETAKLQQQTLNNLLSKRKSKVLEKVDRPYGIEGVTSMSPLQRDLALKLLDQEKNIRLMEKQINALRNLHQRAENKFNKAPELQAVFDDLKRQRNIKESTVNFLINKLRDLAMAQAQEASPWEVIQPPVIPGSPISPNVRRSLMVAFVSGLFTAIATALVLDLLDQRLKRIEEIKELTKVPLLGLIPTVKYPFVKLHDNADFESMPMKGNKYYYKDSSFTEAIRALAINLRYLVTNTNAGKLIAVTSSRPAEGKSTISYNLSLILAELGFKVLLIDGDMRKPNIHKLASLDNEIGLSSAISGTQNPTEIIKNGKIPQLEIITSGPTPPNPVALLDSPNFYDLINQWRDEYDYILIDTPPLGISADTVTIANKVDNVLLTIGMEKITRQVLKNSMETLMANNVNVGGTIVNLIDSKHDYYNYYNYYYYNQRGNNQEGVNGSRRSRGTVENFLDYFRRR